MELLNKLTEQTNIFFNYFPSYKERWKVVIGLFTIIFSLLLIFDYILPRVTDTVYIVYEEIVNNEGILLFTESSGNFIIDVYNYQENFTDTELFVFKTMIFRNIDPIVLYNEDLKFNVMYNLRTSYFITPILSLILSILLIYNNFDKYDEDKIIDAALIIGIFFMYLFNLILSYNSLILLNAS